MEETRGQPCLPDLDRDRTETAERWSWEAWQPEVNAGVEGEGPVAPELAGIGQRRRRQRGDRDGRIVRRGRGEGESERWEGERRREAWPCWAKPARLVGVRCPKPTRVCLCDQLGSSHHLDV